MTVAFVLLPSAMGTHDSQTRITDPPEGTWFNDDFTLSTHSASGCDASKIRVYNNDNNGFPRLTHTKFWCNADFNIPVGPDDRCNRQGREACTVLAETLDSNGDTVGDYDIHDYHIDWTVAETTLWVDETQWRNSGVRPDVTDDGTYSPVAECQDKIIAGGSVVQGWQSRGCHDGQWITINPDGECSVEGTNECVYKVRTRDVAGNGWSAVDTAKLDIDLSGPEATIEGPASGSWQTGDFTVTVSDDDGSDSSGCAEGRYEIYESGSKVESGWRSCDRDVDVDVPWDCGDQGAGTCKVVVWSEDNVGNVGPKASRTFSIDYSGPQISATPADNTWQTDDFTIDVTDNDQEGNGEVNCRYTVWSDNDEEVSDQFRSCSGSIDISVGDGFADICHDQGSYECEVELVAEDELGNTNSREFDYHIDWEAPEPTVTDPAAGSWQGSDFSVQVEDRDAGSGADDCRYRVTSDGSQTRGWTSRSCDSSVTLTVGPDAECRDEGADTCTIDLEATDEVGFTSDVVSVSFGIDMSPPTSSHDVDAEPGVEGGHWYNQAVDVSLSCGDGSDSSGCDTTHYILDGGTQQTYDAPVGISQEGLHSLEYWSVDVAGNVEASTIADIGIDTQDPDTQITSPSPGEEVDNPFRVTFDDRDLGDSGLHECQYEVVGHFRLTVGGPWLSTDNGGFFGRSCNGAVQVSVGSTVPPEDCRAPTLAVEVRCDIRSRIFDRAGNVDLTAPVPAHVT